MRTRKTQFVGAITVIACLAGHASPLRAQGIEVAPFGGYRFGGDFFELITRQPVDLDGAPVLGLAFDVPYSDGLQIEGLFTHQHAHVSTPGNPFGPPAHWHITVDHWQGGGLQEFGRGRARPFLTGLLGLTRYAAEGENEIRFTLSGGGGVKLFPSSRVGLRLDSRVFATFVDANATFLACSPGVCFLAFNADVVWQAEFTAGIVVKLP